ncbi:MAG: SH3 domain-containing protein [Chloroflexi bacterium]|nr:SH3 domain-containing protein [Chloroflexota bacterium]MDA1003394.1 SH3 domain-containing protein [Chloroflexota bacterium]
MRGTRLAALLAAATAAMLCAGCGVGPFAADPTPTPAATIAATPTPAPTAEPTPTPLPVVAHARVTTSDLNVRMGPARSYPAIGRLQPGAEVGILGRSADELWLALDGLGWSFFDATWYELDVAVAALPTVGAEASAAPTHPQETDTGFPLLNDVIADVEAGSADVLASRVTPRTTPCVTTGDAAAGPRCPTGTTAGTPVDAIALTACAAEWAPAAEGRAAIERFLNDASDQRAPLRLYAVLAAAGDDPAAATYVLLFAFERAEARALWLGESGAITRIGTGCKGERAGELLAQIAGDDPVYYVTPFAPPPLSPLR